MLLSVSPGVCLSQGLLHVLVILLLSYHTFLPCSFCYNINFKIVLFPLHLIVDLSLYILHQLVGLRVKFSFVILEDPILFALIIFVLLSLESSFFPQYLLLYFFHLYYQTCLLLSTFGLVTVFLFFLLVSSPIQVLYFYMDFLRGYQFCHRLVLFLQQLGGSPHGVMIKMVDCGIVVSEFECRLCYYVNFQISTLGKSMNFLILPAMG